MADWFKFYENGLDDYKLQAIIQQSKAVIPVWLWILTECCKSKNDRFQFTHSKYEYTGVYMKLNLGEVEINHAFELLQEIGYIQMQGNQVVICTWSERQSDYCKRKVRALPSSASGGERNLPSEGAPSTEPSSDNVRTNSEQCSNTVQIKSEQYLDKVGLCSVRGEEIQEIEKREGGEKRSKLKQNELDLIKKYNLDDPSLLSFYDYCKALFLKEDVKLTSPVGSLEGLKKLLSKEPREVVQGLLHKALLSPKYRPKLLSQWGLINFCERYVAIKETFKQCDIPKPETFALGVRCPEHIKFSMKKQVLGLANSRLD